MLLLILENMVYNKIIAISNYFTYHSNTTCDCIDVVNLY